MSIHPWRSARLVYTAIEVEDDDFLNSIASDPKSFFNAAPFLVAPQDKTHAVQSREYFGKCLLAVKICLPAPVSAEPIATEAAAISKPIPIGTLALAARDPKQAHHRSTSIGINILRAYQGQGYGSEAIKWATRWAFRYGNLHRVEIGAFGWNQGAIRLYKRLGFVPEGCRREHFWYDGKYWDMVELGMLESEWREKFGDEANAVAGAEESDEAVVPGS